MKLYVPLILAVISTVLVIYTLHESYDLNVSELTFGDFQIHPASMGTFFEFFFYVLRPFFLTSWITNRCGILVFHALCSVELPDYRV